MNVRITKIRPTAVIPTYGTERSAGFDLSAAEQVTIPSRGHGLVPTGLVFGIPDGHVLHIFARSSTFPKLGLLLANGVGVIDADYSGPTDELFISMYNPGDVPVTIEPGQRVAQGIIYPRPRVTFVEGSADGPSRGGFGSTGQ